LDALTYLVCLYCIGVLVIVSVVMRSLLLET
jgi:hypothetical protein